MTAHLICLIFRCAHPAPVAVPSVLPPVPPVKLEMPTLPTEDEPDGHLPLRWIFRYDDNGQLPDPWWWKNETNPGYLKMTVI